MRAIRYIVLSDSPAPKNETETLNFIPIQISSKCVVEIQ